MPQQARRVLDRLVGYSVSPLLWKKVKRGLSAGRVQTAALRIVVDREREIDAFIPVEYWSVEADLQQQEPAKPVVFRAIVNTVHGLYALPDDGWRKRAVVYGFERVAASCSDAELLQNEEDLPVLTRLRVPEHRSARAPRRSPPEGT